jgi:hypothetical protein
MTAPTLEDYLWLTSPEGAAALVELASHANSAGHEDVRVVNRLRKLHTAGRAHLLLEQLELRERAREKFERAGELFFTRKGLEQATDDILAGHKAQRFPAGELVADLCCGIGGDTLALAARGPVVAYDADEATAHLARCNLQARGLDPDAIRCQRAEAAMVQDVAAWHIDPDRRATGQRVIQLADYEPGPEFLRELLAVNPNGAVKIAPAAEVNIADWPTCEREWLESRGECRQQVLWFGELAHGAGKHTATEVTAGKGRESFSGQPNQPFDYATSVAVYLYEPSPSVLAAQLAGAFAATHKMQAITSGGGYLTADHLVQHALLSAFRVREVMPFDVRKLRAYCREQQVGQLEIKKRGVEIDPARVRKDIIATGENAAVVIIVRLAGSVKAVVAERVLPP